MKKNEFFNKVVLKLRNLHLTSYAFVSGIYMYVLCLITGVSLGKGCKFYGNSLIRRESNSTIKIGERVRFRSADDSNLIGLNHKCILSTHTPEASLVIGNDCGLSGTVIGVFKEVVLGNNVRCGANTLITDSDWHSDDSRVSGPKSVIIEDNVWLGYGVVVMKGVTIGCNSIIGVGSVVVKDIPRNVIAAGNPCKVLKPIIGDT